jgi:hypothetical protein
MSGYDFFDPFVLFCVVEALAVWVLLVVGFRLSVNCAHVALYGHVTPVVVHVDRGDGIDPPACVV